MITRWYCLGKSGRPTTQALRLTASARPPLRTLSSVATRLKAVQLSAEEGERIHLWNFVGQGRRRLHTLIPAAARLRSHYCCIIPLWYTRDTVAEGQRTLMIPRQRTWQHHVWPYRCLLCTLLLGGDRAAGDSSNAYLHVHMTISQECYGAGISCATRKQSRRRLGMYPASSLSRPNPLHRGVLMCQRQCYGKANRITRQCVALCYASMY